MCHPRGRFWGGVNGAWLRGAAPGLLRLGRSVPCGHMGLRWVPTRLPAGTERRDVKPEMCVRAGEGQGGTVSSLPLSVRCLPVPALCQPSWHPPQKLLTYGVNGSGF